MTVGNPIESRFPGKRMPLLALFLAALLASAACAPLPPPPPPVKTPSKVISEGGMEFYVYGLRFPGTSQDFKMRQGDSLIWLPLNIVEFVRFSGPEEGNYRQGEVTLISGEKFRGELFVGNLLEGTTDVGYWNIPLKDVRNLAMGQ